LSKKGCGSFTAAFFCVDFEAMGDIFSNWPGIIMVTCAVVGIVVILYSFAKFDGE
jgi:hypothetical protein